ncbi:hypothetical protein AMJ87_08455 [candidate division WOR_3 bacterium SM23_60]|uniref:Glycerol-3-phosphate acyltransferase n=1 Tax=candidate division WOR_3 bacterium SM23_60 TaxID=1703780 RepID=A0A0S8GDC7_UNCW3|nr:MAG: hypothetical protein AMJ87_08455 [candidate division WOR_3 bacterium SM23_60]
MSILLLILYTLGGYLIGSVSMARIITRLVAPDLEKLKTKAQLEGSDKTFDAGFISATTVSANLGSRWGFLNMLLDLLKVAIPTMIIKYAYPEAPYFVPVATAGIAGHIWPVYYGFKGGRGLSPIYGGLVAIDWIGVFVTPIAGMLFGLLVLRDVLAAYAFGVFFMIPWVWIRTHNVYFLAYAVAASVLFSIAIFPEAVQWFRLKRDKVWADPTRVMELLGMGRGLLKLARRLGIVKTPEKEHRNIVS